METELGLRLLMEPEDSEERTRSHESVLGAAVLHLAMVVMILISPGGASGYQSFFATQPVQIVELMVAPTTLYVPPGQIVIPEDNTPGDLTAEERRRAVIRTPGGEPPKPGQIFSLPVKPPEQEEGGGDPSEAPSLKPGSTGDEDEAAARADTGEPETGGGEPEVPEIQKGPEVAFLDIPRPSEGQEGLDSLLADQSPGRVLEESLRRSRQGTDGGFTGPGQGTGVSDYDLNTPFPTILSDTRGVDFGPYLTQVVIAVRNNWRRVTPDSVRLGEQGKVMVVFTILSNGDVPDGELKVVSSSGRSHLDRTAMTGILMSQPFQPLPPKFTGGKIVLRFSFFYNLPIEANRR